MASKSAAPVCRWPHEPFWELGGFDFTISLARESQCELSVAALYKRDYTTGELSAKRPSKVNYHRLILNNVALLFRALLFCKDYHPSHNFWKTATQFGLQLGISHTQTIANLFVQARKLYLRGSRSCPNELARLVDEWVAYLERSPPRADAKLRIRLSWNILKQQWDGMWNRGELINCGLEFAHHPGTVLNTPVLPSRAATQNSVPASSSEWRHDPGQVVVKQEAYSDGASPASLAHTSPDDDITRKRKSRRSESPGTPNSRPSKRHANQSREIDETFDYQLQVTEPAQGSTARISPDRLAHATLEKDEDRHAVEQHAASPSSGRSKSSHRSTSLRVTACEDMLAEHINLIHAQDFRLSVQEKISGKYGTKVEVLDARVEFLEQESSRGKKGKEIQGLGVQALGRRDNLSFHVCDDAKQEQSDIPSPFETQRGIINRHLDTPRNDDVAVPENAQKKADKRIHFANITARPERLERDEFDTLATRVTELEKKLRAEKAPLDSEDQNMNQHGFSHRIPTLGLTRRIMELEQLAKGQAECINRLKAEVSRLEKASESNLRQLEEQSNRVAGLWRWIDGLREKVWPLVRHELTPLSAPARHNSQERPQSQD